MMQAVYSSPTARAFSAIIGRASLTSYDVQQYGSHGQSIKSALAAASTFVLHEVVVVGSFSRGSAAHGMSDADLMAVLRRGSVSWGTSLKSSHTVLGHVAGVLQDRFGGTEIGRDGQAVVVHFGGGARPVDVVPALWVAQGGPYHYPLYEIPDGDGGWMRTSPTSHNRYIDEADRRAGGQLKYLAQIFRYWCATRATPVALTGFHVELLLARERIAEGARSYAQVFCDLLCLLASRDCTALNDPLGISGRIPAAPTDAKRSVSLATVVDAAAHACRAVHAERYGNTTEACRQWNIVFNNCFPR